MMTAGLNAPRAPIGRMPFIMATAHSGLRE
jgi:hypothetical protein